LDREKQLPIDDALRIATEVAGALDYAHRRGVIHRDIKPENILLHDAQAFVADFGIALAVANTGDGRLTETGMSLGTPKYMSPEQAMGERTVDARADVYALGCVVYEMITGEPPFTGATAQAIVAKVLTDAPRPMRDVRRSVPVQVDDAVATALEKLPADRFTTAAAFAAALTGSGFARPGRPRKARWFEADRTAVLAAALGVTTLLALGWGIAQRSPRSTARSAPLMRLQFPVEMARMSTGGVLAITPDGSKIVTIEFLPGGLQTHLVVHPLDQSAPTPIVGSEGGLSPFFSPDGAWVAWAAGSRLMRARVDGGPGGAIASPVTDLGASDFVDSGAWTDDGIIVFTSRGGRLYRVNAGGGAAEGIASSIASGVNLPVALPGGKRVLISIEKNTADYEMVVLSTDRGEQLANLGTGLALQYVDAGELVYVTPDGAVMAVPFDAKSLRRTGTPVAMPVVRQAFYARSRMTAVSSGGTIVYAGGLFTDGELVRVTLGGATTVLPVGTSAFRGPRFSPDGRRIAFDIEAGGDLIGDVWIYDQASSAFTRLTFENSSIFPEWTPDGASILYSTVANGKRGIDRIPADRSAQPTRLAEGRAPIFEAVAAPASGGGMMILRQNSDSTGRDIVSTSLDGKSAFASVAAGQFQERSPTISPDGSLLAYVSDESGRDEVYVQPLRGAGRAPVSASGGTEPRWAPSGKEIYYWSRDTLYAAPMTTTPALRVGPRRFVLTGHYSREPFHANYDVAPDGKSFVFVRPVEPRDARGLYVVLNWFSSRDREKK
jgi:serine/threonine-protein kinase